MADTNGTERTLGRLLATTELIADELKSAADERRIMRSSVDSLSRQVEQVTAKVDDIRTDVTDMQPIVNSLRADRGRIVTAFTVITFLGGSLVWFASTMWAQIRAFVSYILNSMPG